jgi:hypothetical protein
VSTLAGCRRHSAEGYALSRALSVSARKLSAGRWRVPGDRPEPVGQSMEDKGSTFMRQHIRDAAASEAARQQRSASGRRSRDRHRCPDR